MNILNEIQSFEKENQDSKVYHHNNSVESEYIPDELKLIDFSDLNQVFHLVKKQTMENQTFKYFLCLLQQLFLIPLNKDSQKIWRNLIVYLKESIQAKENNLNDSFNG